MRCPQFREASSARLDDEDPGLPDAQLDEHLVGCRACASWYEDAARVTRLTRLEPAHPGPDLVGRILAAAPLPAPDRRARYLRIARLGLFLVGLAQLVLATVEFVAHYAHHARAAEEHTILANAEIFHENTSANLALAVGMLWVAWQVRRASGLIPVLNAFVLVLAVMNSTDRATRQLSMSMIGSYALLVLGLLLLAWISRLIRQMPLPRPGDPHRADVDAPSAHLGPGHRPKSGSHSVPGSTPHSRRKSPDLRTLDVGSRHQGSLAHNAEDTRHSA